MSHNEFRSNRQIFVFNSQNAITCWSKSIEPALRMNRLFTRFHNKNTNEHCIVMKPTPAFNKTSTIVTTRYQDQEK